MHTYMYLCVCCTCTTYHLLYTTKVLVGLRFGRYDIEADRSDRYTPCLVDSLVVCRPRLVSPSVSVKNPENGIPKHVCAYTEAFPCSTGSWKSAVRRRVRLAPLEDFSDDGGLCSGRDDPKGSICTPCRVRVLKNMYA